MRADINDVKNILINFHAISWPEKSNYPPKLRTYKIIKNIYGTEDYVKMNLSRSERSILAQFRCGVMPLRVESGRFTGEPVESRICRYCAKNEVENEKHFLLHCDCYNDIRHSYFNDIFHTLSSNSISEDEYFKRLLLNYPRKTAKYLLNAFMELKYITLK